MKFIDKPQCEFKDRKTTQPDLQPIDVIMLTLDAENFLEKSLFTIYREIPVGKLIVCDGGSKDDTINILKKFPRVSIQIRPDIRTGGKALEYLFTLTQSEWFVLVDSDIELNHGWYDEMRKHVKEFDVLENSKRILAYHMYREDNAKLQENSRAFDLCHIIKKNAVKNFHCDDDYMWRYTDILLRQIVEKSGHKYGKVSSAEHTHNEVERIAYESDKEKNFQRLVWKEPEWVVIDKEKAELNKIRNAKAVVKYLDPDYPMVKNDNNIDELISILDRDWIVKNGPSWLKRYDETKSLDFSKRKIRKLLAKIRQKFSYLS